ncbi:muscle M-line assembly protein unc-89-like isoform X2 [Electrophorus electricus]|uniref:muscle M-line assembly protein unc-89-like isoform X2 n=1 Tax=Electrophorus electricus TaxID=8005 RepID=UPI0015D0A20C|nr:muscle M-line assembly protein unc-89-like isoform X2 [Electrophorus electricus]
MTGIQSRGSVGDSSDDEPLSTLMKWKPTPERTHYLGETSLAVDGRVGGPYKQRSSASLVSDFLEDASLKETSKESAAESPGHSSDSEPLSTLLKSKRSAPVIAHRHQKTAVKESSDSEDDQPLTTLIRKTTQKEVSTLDAKSPKRCKMRARASSLRQSSPSRVKTTQKRGRKGKPETERMDAAPSTAENQMPKRRGRPKKADTQAKAPSSDTSDDEPLSLLVGKKSQPEMKQAVVVLKRLSKSDVMDAMAQERKRSREQIAGVGTGSAVESSDEEPLSLKVKRLKRQTKPAQESPAADTSSEEEPLEKQVKTAQGKYKGKERTNGEDETPKPESKLAEVLKEDLDDKCLAEREPEETPPSPQREPGNS